MRDLKAGSRFHVFDRYCTGAEHLRIRASAIDDGRLDTNLAVATVKNNIITLKQLTYFINNMRSAGRANPTKSVSARRGYTDSRIFGEFGKFM
ncbi:unannotated protein [freshwater metagenome]|uniref:Unannotated protein n=1 Tax=freshwater metagenome TaxID=449393 RepID=A0A6J7ATS7_9ZZZZ